MILTSFNDITFTVYSSESRPTQFVIDMQRPGAQLSTRIVVANPTDVTAVLAGNRDTILDYVSMALWFEPDTSFFSAPELSELQALAQANSLAFISPDNPNTGTVQ